MLNLLSCLVYLSTSAERNLALDSAEKIQASYEDFQHRVKDKLRAAEDQLKEFVDEKERLLRALHAQNLQLDEVILTLKY